MYKIPRKKPIFFCEKQQKNRFGTKFQNNIIHNKAKCYKMGNNQRV